MKHDKKKQWLSIVLLTLGAYARHNREEVEADR